MHLSLRCSPPVKTEHPIPHLRWSAVIVSICVISPGAIQFMNYPYEVKSPKSHIFATFWRLNCDMNLLPSQNEIFLLTYIIYLFILSGGEVPFQKRPLGHPQDEISYSGGQGPHWGLPQPPHMSFPITHWRAKEMAERKGWRD